MLRIIYLDFCLILFQTHMKINSLSERTMSFSVKYRILKNDLKFGLSMKEIVP